MKYAFLYAGQGSQRVGMGLDFYEKFPAAAAMYDRLPEIKRLSHEGPLEELTQTKSTQPAMVLFAAAVTGLLFERGIKPCAAAGLSLGEYSALYASGAISFEELMPLIEYRGQIMQEAAEGIECRMAAVLGLSVREVCEAVEKAQSEGIVDVCNINCPGQVVIGGECAAVDSACEYAKQMGARRCMPLNVSGPFHTRMMENASKLLGEKLKTVQFGKMNIPVYCNLTGRVLQTDIAEALTRQIKEGVMFEQTINQMARAGIDTIVEIGPGKVLSGFVRKTAPQIRIINIETVQDFESAISLLEV